MRDPKQEPSVIAYQYGCHKTRIKQKFTIPSSANRQLRLAVFSFTES
nr:MAG TPA: hypothetical protein [Bacteriophage sp.]